MLWVLILSKRSGKPIAAVPSRKGKSRKQIINSMRGKLKKTFKFTVVTKSELNKLLINRGKSIINKRSSKKVTKKKTTRRSPSKGVKFSKYRPKKRRIKRRN